VLGAAHAVTAKVPGHVGLGGEFGLRRGPIAGILGGMDRRHVLTLTALLLSSALGLAAAQAPQTRRPDAPNLAPYVPTPQEVVDRMLALAKVTKDDVLIDLGCGDGRIPITAAKAFGARGIGVDIDPQRIAEANANARREGVAHLVTFKLENALTTDVSTATVVTTYLLSASNLKLRPVLTRALKPGTRIVAHNYGFGDWVPEKTETFTDNAKTRRTIYLWTADGIVRP
jgi:SAM-dependent methyltransferase